MNNTIFEINAALKLTPHRIEAVAFDRVNTLMAIWVLLHVPVVIAIDLRILLHVTIVLSELCCITTSTDILLILLLKVVAICKEAGTRLADSVVEQLFTQVLKVGTILSLPLTTNLPSLTLLCLHSR